jgi:hypothetical protein
VRTQRDAGGRFPRGAPFPASESRRAPASPAGSVDAKYDDLFNTMSSSRDYDGMGSGRILRSRGFAEHWKQTLGLAGVTPP